MARRSIRVLLLLLVVSVGLNASLPALEPAHGGRQALAAERICLLLIEEGFEEVQVHADSTRILVRYENRRYRYELRALGVVALLSANEVDPSTSIQLIPLSLGIPILAVEARAGDWLDFLEERTTSEWFLDHLKIADNPTTSPRSPAAPTAPSNRSLWKADLTLRPLVSFKFGIPEDAMQYSLWLAPELTMSPFTGCLLTSQIAVRMKDDLDPLPRNVRPGRNTMTWVDRLPGAWLATTSVGYFPEDRYGAVFEMGRFLLDGILEMKLGADLSGVLEFADGVTLYSDPTRWSALISLTHRKPGIDLETTITGGHFLEGDLGVQVDLARRFHESTLGFFAIMTQADIIGGMRFQIPLFGQHLPPPSRLRLAAVTSFPFEYRDSLNSVGMRIANVNNLDWFRKKLNPVFLRNNIDDLRLLPNELRLKAR